MAIQLKPFGKLDYVLIIVCVVSVLSILYVSNNMANELNARDQYWQDYMEYYKCLCINFNESEEFPFINSGGLYNDSYLAR